MPGPREQGIDHLGWPEHGTGAGEAIKLRARTHLPRILWAGRWLIGSILALAVGCTLLV
jgi:hypothetical protein